MKTSIASVSFAALLTVALSSAAFASEGAPAHEQKPLQPSKRYSGSSPVDLSNGLPFNNGTFGLRNSEYESWAKSKNIAVGVSEKMYPYAEKADFVRNVEERLFFYDQAIRNWNQTSEITKPEAIEYSKAAIQDITPRLDKAKQALKAANGAGSGDWEKAQFEAKRALLDLQGAYYQMHRNPAMN